MADYEMNVTGITVADKEPKRKGAIVAKTTKRKYPRKPGRPYNNFEKVYLSMAQVRRSLVSAQRELEAAKKRAGELKAAKPCYGCGRPTLGSTSRIPRGYGCCQLCFEARNRGEW